MSISISLKQTWTHRTDVALHLVQHALTLAGLLLLLGIAGLFSHYSRFPAEERSFLGRVSVGQVSESRSVGTPEDAGPDGVALSPLMQGAIDYVARRYRVSAEALQPVFEAAQVVGQERRIDPLLIVAVIGVESGFNPFAESSMGAQGLMQVIPRFHMDKVPGGASGKSFFDPELNVRVGVSVLEEAIRRNGGLVAGLQYYAGSSDPEGSYANKVLAEKERLEQAARKNVKSRA